MSTNYFVTAALPYINNVPHLGNIIGSTLSADVYARYLRKCGKNVTFVCGTDEYGTATELKAQQEGLGCEEICAKYRALHKEVYDWFNISFDIFGKTTTETHTELAQEIFTSLYKKGLFVEKETEQFFCETCSKFVCDRYIHGVCYYPDCGGVTKGDQCDDCKKLVNVEKLAKKWCSVCKSIPIKKTTWHLYLKIDEFTDRLTEYFLGQHPGSISYISQIAYDITKAWIKRGLEDRSVTRDLKWGTPIPKLAGLEKYWDKVLYVWFDAPIGYLSILKHAKTDWRDWIGCNSKWIQFLAKDNVPFHSIIFPATLYGSDLDTKGVTHLVSTEYLMFDGKKFSKSENIGIFGNQVQKLSNELDIDEDYWRYYLIKIRPESADSEFTYENFCTVVKTELAQKIGNLINRILCLHKKTYGVDQNIGCKDELIFEFDSEIKGQLCNIILEYFNAFEKFCYHDVIKSISKITDIGNMLFDKYKLWEICKMDGENAKKYFGNVCAVTWLYGELCEPIMPKKSKKIKSYFNCGNINNGYDNINEIINNGFGIVQIDSSNIEILFKQFTIGT